MLKRAVLLKLSWLVPPSLHMFSKVQRWTPFQKSIFAELSQKIHLIKCHIHSQLIEKLEHITMLLKFSTFRYNNVNRASKTKVKESVTQSCQTPFTLIEETFVIGFFDG